MTDNRQNTGDYNTGYYNTGYYNTGNRNTGDWNTGDWNTGNRNTGDWNTGDWNTGDWNTGYCNSITPEDILIFNKPSTRATWYKAKKPNWLYVNLTEWVSVENMTDREKQSYPDYVTTGGYLKHYSSLKHAYIDAWENTTQEDRDLTKELPNFDPVVFEEVFGFNPFKEITKTIILDGKEIKISEESYKAFKEQFKD